MLRLHMISEVWCGCEETGYHRRDGELAELEGQLGA